MQCQVVVENERSDQCDEDSAQSTSESYGEVISREMSRMRLLPTQLTMADHTTGEQHPRKHEQLHTDLDRLPDEHEPYGEDRRENEGAHEPRPDVPAVMVKSDDEGQ